MDLSREIADWIKEKVKSAGKKGIVLGLSGGVDSAVVACLSKKAMGNNVLSVLLPCHSSPDDLKHAKDVAKTFNIKTKEVLLDKIHDELVKMEPSATDLAKANLKPRLRMMVLYYFANTLDYLVAGTGNKSELSVGYFTKYGDGGVDILPIGGLLKSEVKELAKKLGVPKEIIDRPPSAGLWHGQTDEGEMGITYDELDKAITAIEENKLDAVNIEVLNKVKSMMEASEHKRDKAPVFEKGGTK